MIDFINSQQSCCGELTITPLDEKVAEAISQLRNTIVMLFDKATNDIVFSLRESVHINNLNDIRYLIQYLSFVDEIRTEEIAEGEVRLVSEYYEDYCIEKIKRYFHCR